MAIHSFPVIDIKNEVFKDQFEVAPNQELQLGGSKEWKISKRRLSGGVSNGIDLVEINNGRLSMTVIPTRGMGLWKGSCDNLRLGWDSPVENLVHPSLINPTLFNGIGWLKGFNELLCRCGISWHGAPGLDKVKDNSDNISETPLTLHGQIANTPAHRVDIHVETDGKGTLSVTGEVDETMLFGPRLRLKTRMETEAGSNWFRITDEIINIGGQTTESEILYHTNFGSPFLEGGSKLVAPVKEVTPCNDRSAKDMKTWTVYRDPVSGFIEQCHFLDIVADNNQETVVMLKNSTSDHAVSLSYNVKQLPSFTVWKNTQAVEDGYVTGLEPGTSLPNNRSFERSNGRIISLAPGESYQTGFTLTVLTSAEEVSETEAQIRELQSDTKPEIHQSPISKWTPGVE